MLKPADMQKIRVLLPKSNLNTAIAALHDLGVIEIVTAEYKELEKGKHLATYDEIAEQLVRMRAIKKVLGPRKVKPQRIEGKKALEQAKQLQIDEEIRQLNEKKERLGARQNTLKEHLKLAEKLLVFSDVDFSKLRTQNIEYWLGKAEKKRVRRIEARLKERFKNYHISSARLNKKEDILLIIYRKNQPVEEELTYTDVHQIEVPQAITVPKKAIEEITKEMEENTEEIQKIKQRFKELADGYYEKVTSLEKALRIEADRAEIAFRFNFTQHVALIEGWVRRADIDQLRQTMTMITEAVVVQEVESQDIPPTLLENPKIVGPFEFITKQFSLPNAREIDPSMIYLIALPLLYAMIVGDVFYGIASYFIASWIIKKFKNSFTMRNVGQIWKASALPAIFFGVLFDEWGGMSHLHLLETLAQWGLPVAIHAPLYIPFVHRIHELSALIGITIVVGLIHLGIGFLMGAINEWHHNKKHAIGKLVWIFVEISGTLAAGGLLLGIFPAELGNIGAIGVVIGAVLLFLTEGVIGILELPGLAGNVLSYARIAAIGVVGVALAEIINEVFLPLPEHGLLALLFFPLCIGLHAINAFIAMFESLIQGGRLNIIEFRSKFLIGGGKPFEPFSYSYE